MSVSATDTPSASATRPYLCHLISNTWFNFRVPELRAVAGLAGVELAIDPEEEAALREESVFLTVRVADDASVARLAARTVMVRRFVDLWASGDSWETLAATVRALSPEVYGAYLAEGTTFKVRVEAFGRAFSEAEKVEQIERLGQLLPFRGKVRLKAPQHSFVLLCDQSTAGRPPRLYFGREVASGQRELPGVYDLKRRNYIGTTSLDAELALLMANLARVRPHHLVRATRLATPRHATRLATPRASPRHATRHAVRVLLRHSLDSLPTMARLTTPTLTVARCATPTAAQPRLWWRRRTLVAASWVETSSHRCSS
jgi:hypothetical protein